MNYTSLELVTEREKPSCSTCGSTLRFRSIIRTLSVGLFGKSLILNDFPEVGDIFGIGLSEWVGYTRILESKFGFLNTFFHQEPFLDITKPPKNMIEIADFLISSEVFEHIPPPVQAAFDGAYSILKPGGVLILTVPFRTDIHETLEHYPDLFEWKIVEQDNKYTLVNITKDNQKQVFNNLCFHGGPGMTLEMRVFSKLTLQKHLVNSGFTDIVFCSENEEETGIIWRGDWSVPIIARKPS